MPVLKRKNSSDALKSAIVLEMGDVRRQAARVIADAQAQARKIIEAAQEQEQRISAEARDQACQQGEIEGRTAGLDQGRQLGHAEALEQSSEQLAQLQSAWREAMQSFDAHRQQLDSEARGAVLEFALLLGQKLVHRMIHVDDNVIIDQVAQALGRVLCPMDVAVHIQPQDRPVLEQAMPELLAQMPQLQHVRLVDDPTVARGGCIVRYGQGRIDATIDTQMQRIVELMAPARRATQVVGE